MLEIVTMQMCESINGPKVVMVPSETAEGLEYVVGGLFHERIWPSCTCPAYVFAPRTIQFGSTLVKPHCKHIRAAQRGVCQWHKQWSEERQTTEQQEANICPRCGGPTVFVSAGV